MKTLFNLFVLVILCCQYLYSQVDTSEYKVGDWWLVWEITENFEQPPILHEKIIGDTLIGQRLWSLMGVFKNNNVIAESIIPIFRKNNKVSFWEHGQEYPLYDFDLQVGDTFTYYIPTVGHLYNSELYDSSMPPIDEPEPKTIIVFEITMVASEEGQMLKKFILAPDYHYNSMGEIVEIVGSERGFFGGTSIIAVGVKNNNTCDFHSAALNYNFENWYCANATSTPNNSTVVVYPNPTENIVQANHTNISAVRVYDSYGQQKPCFFDVGRQQVDMQRLPPSVYTIHWLEGHQPIGVSRVIKL